MRKMSEDQIERSAERFMDQLDACLLSGRMSQRTYDREVKRLHAWAMLPHWEYTDDEIAMHNRAFCSC